MITKTDIIKIPISSEWDRISDDYAKMALSSEMMKKASGGRGFPEKFYLRKAGRLGELVMEDYLSRYEFKVSYTGSETPKAPDLYVNDKPCEIKSIPAPSNYGLNWGAKVPKDQYREYLSRREGVDKYFFCLHIPSNNEVHIIGYMDSTEFDMKKIFGRKGEKIDGFDIKTDCYYVYFYELHSIETFGFKTEAEPILTDKELSLVDFL